MASGHLRPNFLSHRDPLIGGVKPTQEVSGQSGRRQSMMDRTRDRHQMINTESHMHKKDSALCDFTVVTAVEGTCSLGPKQSDGQADVPCGGSREKGSSCLLDPTELLLFKPGGARDRRWFTRSHLAGLTSREQLERIRKFEQLVLKKQDLVERSWVNRRKVGTKKEWRLEQELGKLCVNTQPSRKHLHMISSVFDNVCQEFKVLGDILREIKVEYDLYLASLLSAQTELQSMPGEHSMGGTGDCQGSTTGEQKLEEAREEVSRLSQKALEALRENEKVRQELQNILEKIPEEKEVSKETTQANQKVEEEPNSSTGQVQSRHQCQDVQNLEGGIKENLVCTVSTSAAGQCVRDMKDEILRIQASNKRLLNRNMALEGSISMVFRRAKVNDRATEELWEKILNTLRYEDEQTSTNVNP